MSVVDPTAYANAIASFVTAVGGEVEAVRERDAALARLEAVRALCDELEASTGRVSVVQVAASIRAVLDDDGPDRAGSPTAPPIHVQESTPRHQVTTHPPTALKSTMGDPQ